MRASRRFRLMSPAGSFGAYFVCCLLFIVAYAAAANPNAATQPADLKPAGIWTSAIENAATRMKQTAIAISLFENQHHGQSPHDLGSLVAIFSSSQTNCFQTPGDERLTPTPQLLTADWVNAHTSYVYLAADFDPKKLDPSINPAGTTVIAFHTKLDEPFTDPVRGAVIIATCLDGHSEILQVDQARTEIERSKKILAAAR